MTVELPETIPGVVKRAAEVFGDREAIVDGDVRLTFAELAERVERAAGAFIGSGIEPGDCASIWAPNVWEWAVASSACTPRAPCWSR